MRYIIYLVVLLFVSIVMYLPVITPEDKIMRAYMDGFNYTFSWLVWILFATFVLVKNRNRLKAGLFVTLVLSLAIVFLPRMIHTYYEAKQESDRLNKDFTVQEIKERFYSSPENWSPPMKNVELSLENGHLSLSMTFNEEAAKLVKMEYDQTTFKEEICHFVRSEAHGLTPYTQLKLLTVRAEFHDTIYSFDKIPLKDEEGNPFDIHNDTVDTIIQQKMQVR